MIHPLRLRPRFTALVGVGAGALIAACVQVPESSLATASGEVMGTRYNIRVALAREQPMPDFEAVGAALRAVDDAMTTYRDSQVTRFNDWQSTDPFTVDADTASVVRQALHLAASTGGALDVTVGPLVRALGFGSEAAGELPSPAEIAALRRRIGYRLLSVDDDNRLRKASSDLEIDLSSIAKGFGVDRAAGVLDTAGFANYMVEVGGEVRARGINEHGRPWRIGIEKPDDAGRGVQRIVPLRDMALATSGDYRNYREIDGRRWSHLIDPRTGQSITHRVASATVLHAECTVADGLATAMMVLGEAGLELAEAEGWAVLLLIRENDGFVELESSAFGELVESAQPESP